MNKNLKNGMKVSRLVLCGTGHGGKALFDGCLNSELKSKIEILIKTDSEKNVLEEFRHLISKNEDEDLSEIKESDLVITSSFKPIIPNNVLSKAQFLNIHYALLPRFRGMHPIVWGIINGEENVGFSLHETTNIVDGGPIWFQEKFPVGEKTAWELMIEIERFIAENIGKIVLDYLEGKLDCVEQREMDAICVAKRNLKDCEVDWDKWNIIIFRRMVKALVKPYPLPYFYYKKKKYEIQKTHFREIDYIEINGHVVHRDENSVGIKIPGGIVYLDEIIQPDGKTISPAKIFNFIGARLNG